MPLQYTAMNYTFKFSVPINWRTFDDDDTP